jgi:hypothetical protein
MYEPINTLFSFVVRSCLRVSALLVMTAEWIWNILRKDNLQEKTEVLMLGDWLTLFHIDSFGIEPRPLQGEKPPTNLVIHKFSKNLRKPPTNLVIQGPTNFPKIWEPPQSPRGYNCDRRQFPFPGLTNIRRHPTKFSRPGVLAPGICDLLSWSMARQTWCTLMSSRGSRVRFIVLLWLMYNVIEWKLNSDMVTKTNKCTQVYENILQGIHKRMVRF